MPAVLHGAVGARKQFNTRSHNILHLAFDRCGVISDCAGWIRRELVGVWRINM